MPPQLTYDLLVHPFFGLNSAVVYSMGPFNEIKKYYAPFYRKWYNYVVALKSQPNRALLIIPSNLSRPEARQLLLKLVAFARNNLGERAVVSNDANKVKSLGVNRKKAGKVFGEYNDACVEGFSKWFTDLTGQRLIKSSGKCCTTFPFRHRNFQFSLLKKNKKRITKNRK